MLTTRSQKGRKFAKLLWISFQKGSLQCTGKLKNIWATYFHKLSLDESLKNKTLQFRDQQLLIDNKH